MRIERKYVSFFVLSQTDEQAKKVFEGTIKKYTSDAEEAQRLIDYHYSHRTMVYGAEMGYCIPHFDEIVRGFEVLDEENPYDNGFDVTDTNEVIITGKSDDYIELHLIKRFDGEEYIIKVQRITNE